MSEPTSKRRFVSKPARCHRPHTWEVGLTGSRKEKEKKTSNGKISNIWLCSWENIHGSYQIPASWYYIYILFFLLLLLFLRLLCSLFPLNVLYIYIKKTKRDVSTGEVEPVFTTIVTGRSQISTAYLSLLFFFSFWGGWMGGGHWHVDILPYFFPYFCRVCSPFTQYVFFSICSFISSHGCLHLRIMAATTELSRWSTLLLGWRTTDTMLALTSLVCLGNKVWVRERNRRVAAGKTRALEQKGNPKNKIRDVSRETKPVGDFFFLFYTVLFLLLKAAYSRLGICSWQL